MHTCEVRTRVTPNIGALTLAGRMKYLMGALCCHLPPPHVQEDGLAANRDLPGQFKPVVPWPHVEGVEVDLNSIRQQHGETPF